MMVFLLFIVFALITLSGTSKKAEKNNSSTAHAFDFWIGNWRIQQKILRQDGSWLELPAKTRVSPVLDGRALVEHWQGDVQFFWEGMQSIESINGLSVRSFDSESGKWYIHWMDSRSPRFGTPYSGNFVEGKGEFFRDWETPQGKRIGRITFSYITADSVHWDLAVSSDEGSTWAVLWIMDMERD